MVDLLGIVLGVTNADEVVGTIDVDARHQQPYGIIHGGTHCALVETLASTGGAMWAMEQGMAGVVGVSNTTDFIRPHRSGPITGRATPIHRGRTQQLWQVEVTDDERGKLLARGQVRLQNLQELPG
jgi:1,4-dihydroxy-2-naphthoyl-CoA hydrolase